MTEYDSWSSERLGVENSSRPQRYFLLTHRESKGQAADILTKPPTDPGKRREVCTRIRLQRLQTFEDRRRGSKAATGTSCRAEWFQHGCVQLSECYLEARRMLPSCTPCELPHTP